MSQLSRSTFETTYVNAAGTFADNSTREISEGDMRQYADDVSDSAVFKNDDYDYWIKTITAAGTDTYTITPTIPVAYASDEKWLIRFTNSNTGASTLNRNSLGAKSLLTNSGGALSAGDIVAGGIYIVNYNGTNYRILNVVAGTGSVSGLTTPRIPYATSATTLGDNAGLVWDNVNAFLSLGAGVSPDRQFHIEKDSAATNTVTYLQRLTSTSTGTPAAGIGVGMEFEVETAGGNNEMAGSVEYVITSVTGTTERAKKVDSLLWQGALTEMFTMDYNSGSAIVTYDLAKGISNTAVARAIKTTYGDLSLITSASGDDVGIYPNGANQALFSPNNGNTLTSAISNILSTTANSANLFVYGGTATGVTFPGVLKNATTGALNAGTGVGLSFQSLTSAGNTETGATIEAITTDVTVASEDFDLVFKTMAAGAAVAERFRVTSTSNYGFNGATSFGSGAGVMGILNAVTNASAALTTGIIIHSRDSSDANATLALYTEQAPEATATFTQTHRLKVWVNGTEYWLSLDSV